MLNSYSALTPATSVIYSMNALPRSPVGEESVDLPESVLKPVEQAADTQKVTLETDKLKQTAEEKRSKAQKQQQLQEQEQINQLAARDREVRNHERAHAAVGGQYAGAPRYEYQRGPDGVNYAVAGEVSISTSAIPGDPQMTIEKAQVIKRAALAPAEPSAQDRKVAAEAVQMEMQARVELSEKQHQERLQEQQSEEAAVSQNADETDENIKATEETDSVGKMNKTQEEAFNEINNDLTAQLISLGVSRQQPQSLGSILSRFV
jgi:hypothetical protein